MEKFLKSLFTPRYRYSRLAWLYIHNQKLTQQMGSCISRGNNVHTRLWYLGKGEMKANKILKCYTFGLFTLSINIVFFFHFSWKITTQTLFMWNRRNTPLTIFGPHKNLSNSNLVSKLAAEWIFLSFDTSYYTELPPYSQKRRLKTGSYTLFTRGSSFSIPQRLRNDFGRSVEATTTTHLSPSLTVVHLHLKDVVLITFHDVISYGFHFWPSWCCCFSDVSGIYHTSIVLMRYTRDNADRDIGWSRPWTYM